jgi:hypothetical protein
MRAGRRSQTSLSNEQKAPRLHIPHRRERGHDIGGRLHKELLEFERIDHVSDEMRAVIEDLWPELVHKLPPKDA